MRLYWRADLTSATEHYDDEWNSPSLLNQQHEPATPDEANLVSSLTASGKHMPAIDIDLPVRVVESSTKGHHHLFIDKEIEPEQYWQILKALYEAGIVERGFYELSVARGSSFLRTHPKGAREEMSDVGETTPAAITALRRFRDRFVASDRLPEDDGREDYIPF